MLTLPQVLFYGPILIVGLALVLRLLRVWIQRANQKDLNMAGSSVGGKTTISLRQLFPQLTEAQLTALNNNQPCPPSPDWVPDSGWLNLHSQQLAAIPKTEDKPPRVSCILVVSHAARVNLARQSVNQFAIQTYDNKELVIINATGKQILTQSWPGIQEIATSPASIGVLRNRAIKAATGEWIKLWDDDDIFNPLLLSYMMGSRRAEHASLLRYQIRANVELNNAFVMEREAGIPATMLFPNEPGLTFEDISAGEDMAFWIANFANRTHVINNERQEALTLSIAIWHGKNATTAESFMDGNTEPAQAGQIALPPAATKTFIDVMGAYGFKIEQIK